MPSKTLFSKGLFSPTLLRSDLTRFWPLWAAYFLLWLIAMPGTQFLTLFQRSTWAQEHRTDLICDAQQLVLEMGSGEMFATIAALIFGCLFAMALFSYLMNARSVSFSHALPVKREGLFLTHYCTGVLVFVGVHAAVALLTMAVWAAAGITAFGNIWIWFLSLTGQMLFFYSFAVFCAMFAGQILAIPTFYAIFNLLAVVLTYLFSALAQMFFHGWVSSDIPVAVEWLTPTWKLISSVFVTINYGDDGAWLSATFHGLPYVAIYAAAGVVLAALALLVYRRRSSESAGDTVAISWAKPLFRYGMGYFGGLLIGLTLYAILWREFYFGESAPALAVCTVIGGLVGYFTAEMLLRKSFRVLKTGWKGAVALAAVLTLTCAGFAMDPFGVSRRIPAADQVQSLNFSIGSYDYLNGTTEDPAVISQIIDLHQQFVEQGPDENQAWQQADSDIVTGYSSVYLRYTLLNGSTVSRRYELRYQKSDLLNPDSLVSRVAATYAQPEVQFADLQYFLEQYDQITGGSLDYIDQFYYYENGYTGNAVSINADDAQALLDAFLRDIEAGRAGVDAFDWDASQETTYWNTITLYYTTKPMDGERAPDNSSITLQFSTRYTEVLAGLEKLGLQDLLMTRKEVDDETNRMAGMNPNSFPDGTERSLVESSVNASVEIIGGADSSTGILVAEPADTVQTDPVEP